MVQKRLFVGNLPLNVEEKEIEKKFSKFGSVVSTEVKQRLGTGDEVISKFAFITLEANKSDFDACMEKLSSTTWQGHHLKLEFAKESFLTKLKREQDENKQNKLMIKDKFPISKTDKNDKESKQLFLQKQDFKTHVNGYHSDSSSDEVKGDLPKFAGTKSFSFKEENQSPKNQINSANINNYAAMKTFEDFSDVWKDNYYNVDLPHIKSKVKMDLEKENYKTSFTEKSLKETKQWYEEENLNTQRIMQSPKWFTKPMSKQNENFENDFTNYSSKSSNYNDYSTLNKNKPPIGSNLVDDIEIVGKDYLNEKEHNINRSAKSTNKPFNYSNSSDHKLQQENATLQSSKDITRKRKESFSVLDTQHSKHIKTNLSEMLKNDFDKIAEEKRKKAFEEKRQLLNHQKSTVKIALAGIDGKGKLNKKIVFSDNDNSSIEDAGNDKNNQIKSSNDHGFEKKKLFDGESDDDDDDNETNFKVNQQFEGVKGQKLLELQSRYAHDHRFALDSRFYESDEENNAAETSQPKNEKEKQLEILEQVVGHQVRKPDSSKKIISKPVNNNTMLLRYDPTRVEHSQFVVQSAQPEGKIDIKEKKKKREIKADVIERKQEEAVQVSKETFYKVNERIKDSLQTKDNSNFSLRKLFKSKESDQLDIENVEEHVEESASLPPKRLRRSNPFRYDSSDAEDEDDEDIAVPLIKPTTQPTLMEPFFFQTNDTRFEELREFFQKHSEEHLVKTLSEEEFSKKRKDLKRLIRHRQMNKKQKNRPFRNKLGGSRKSSFVSKDWNRSRSKVRPCMFK